MIYRLVMSNNGNEEDAKDLFQTGMIILYEKIKDNEYQKRSSLRTYFYSICRYQWLNQLKLAKRMKHFVDVARYEDSLEDVSLDDIETPLSEMQEILQKQFIRLDENCQKILIMFYYQNLSMHVIAERIGYTNAGNAKSQKYRCIQKLQGLMAPFRNIYK